MKNKLYSKKNTYLSVVWAVFHLRGPASALVGCLCGLLWISCTFRKNTLKKQTYLWPKRHVWRRLGPFPSSWASFSLFVGLRWLLWAFVGIHGCRPRQRGVWWVWCSRLSCTVKKKTATGVSIAKG